MRSALGAANATAALALLVGCTQPSTDDRYTAIYERLHPSVVLLTMQIPADDPKRKGQWDDAYGSGVVVDSGDWGTRILTDAHVVADARALRATVGDRGKPAPVRVVATTGDDDDLALLEIPERNLPVAPLGRSDGIRPGRPIGVLGYPIPDAFSDEKLQTVVSLYTGRVASVRNGAFEVDVPIIPGESGGPAFDLETGEVIGVAESRFEEERAIGFVTPVDIVRRFLAAHPRRPTG